MIGGFTVQPAMIFACVMLILVIVAIVFGVKRMSDNKAKTA